MSGKPLTECYEELVAYIRLRPASAPPNGESFDEFRDRFLSELDQIRREHAGETVLICTHSKNERLLEGWRQTGGGECEQINPDSFLHKGLGPAQYRTDIKLAEGEGAGDQDDDEADEAAGDDYDDDADDAQPAAKSRPAPKARSTTTPPWNSRPIEPKHSADADLWTESIGGRLDGTAKGDDPFDLKPKIPLRRRSQSWSNTVLEPMKRER
jgi:hypothetical protein